MDRTEVLDIVINNLRRNVDGIDDIEIDPQNSMAQYGASSLDIVEVVSASLRDLDIDIPRTKMAHLKNIGQLADLLTEIKNR
jgi:acyl carrier protein